MGTAPPANGVFSAMKTVSARLLVLLGFVSLAAGCGGPTPPPGVEAGTTTSGPVVDKLKDFGDYTVHFSAITTDLLSPEVAQQYNLVRSKSRAMLNVSVRRDEEGTIGVAVPGKVVVKVTNLTGQLKGLELRQITEGEAIYYIGDLSVANGEVLIFDIDVTPNGESDPLSVKYQQKFVTE